MTSTATQTHFHRLNAIEDQASSQKHQRCQLCKAGFTLKQGGVHAVRLALLYSFNLCWADVMAPSTDCLLTRFLMLEAVPNSSPSIFWARDTCAAMKPQGKSVMICEKFWTGVCLSYLQVYRRCIVPQSQGSPDLWEA